MDILCLKTIIGMTLNSFFSEIMKFKGTDICFVYSGATHSVSPPIVCGLL